jgi:hypothetical protein
MALRGFAGLGAAAIFAAGSAFAQGQPVQPAQTSGAGSIPIGPLVVYPGINLAVGHDDNLFLTPNVTRSSAFTVLSPYVRAEAKHGPHTFDATLRIDDGRYNSSSPDDYTDYSLRGNGDLVFSGRAGLKLRADYLHGHDPRGSTDAVITATPNEYNNYGIGGLFRYGAPGARGRIEIDGSLYTRRYTNNRLATESIDHDTNQIGGTFYWRVMPRTELLAQLTYTDFNYLQGISTQDSSETRFLVGAKWEATAKTSGYAKFGRLRKEFDSPAQQNTSDSSWDLGVRWSPLTYSVFDFVTNRQTYESTGLGNTILGTNYGVTWSHGWSSRLRTQALANYRTDDYKGFDRNDDTTSFGLRADYDFRRWLRFGAQYTYWNRDSNLSTFEYKRNLFMLTVGATL